MTQQEIDRRLATARKRVARMDAIDGAPVPPALVPATAAEAILAALRGSRHVYVPSAVWAFKPDDLGCIFDALVMLQQVPAPTVPA